MSVHLTMHAQRTGHLANECLRHVVTEIWTECGTEGNADTVIVTHHCIRRAVFAERLDTPAATETFYTLLHRGPAWANYFDP